MRTESIREIHRWWHRYSSENHRRTSTCNLRLEGCPPDLIDIICGEPLKGYFQLWKGDSGQEVYGTPSLCLPLCTMSFEMNCPVLADSLPALYEEYTPNRGKPSMVLVVFHSFCREDQSFDPGQGADNKAWRTRNEFKTWINWLAEDFPNARILSIAYPLSFGAMKSNVRNRLDMPFLYDRILREMRGALQNHNTCPVILAADSIGCFVVQETCLTAHKVSNLGWLVDNDEAGRLLFLISGIIFLLPSSLVEARSGLSKSYLERSWSGFLMLGKSRNWKIIVSLGKVPMASYCGVVFRGSSAVVEDCVPKVHQVGQRRPGQRDDPLYKSFVNSLQNHLDELRTAQPASQEQTNLVGLDTVVRQLRKKAQQQRNSLHQLCLTGVAGIGKTTLSKAVFDSLKNEFVYTCFVELASEEFQNFRRAQRSFQDIILTHMKRWGREEQLKEWRMLERKKVLLVLDDADSDTLENLSSISAVFDQGSWIVCTSRMQSDFECFGFLIHKVQPLQENDSLTLFKNLAFPPAEVPVELNKKAEEVTGLCGGSPLLIRLTAQHLRGKPGSDWTRLLKVLKGAISSPEEESLAGLLVDKLDNAFKSLADLEKKMFLDLAICFHGEDKDETLAALRGMYPGRADSGWENLLDRNLSTVGYSTPNETPRTRLQRGLPASSKLGIHEEIAVHEALRLLGRKLCLHELHLHQRVADKGTACELLRDQNSEVYEKVRIIKLDGWSTDGPPFDIGRISTMTKLKALWLTDVPLSGLERNTVDLSPQLSSIMIRLSGRTISSLETIQFKPEIPLSTDLHRLFPLHSQSSTRLKHLTLISGGKVPRVQETMPSDQSSAGVVSFCGAAHVIPDVEILVHLEHLVLDAEFVETERLSESLGQLKHLRFLQISVLPSSLVNLSAIEVLKLWKLGSIKELPESLGNLQCLHCLEIVDCDSLEVIPETLGKLSRLDSLMIRHLNSLVYLPQSIGELKNLTHMALSVCKVLKRVPSVGQLHSLNYLELSDLMLPELPVGIGDLPQLEALFIRNLEQLRDFPESIGDLASLQYLELHNCSRLEELPVSLGKLGKLQSLNISHCMNMEKLPHTFGQLTELRDLTLFNLPLLKRPPASFTNLSNLRVLNVEQCSYGFSELIYSLLGSLALDEFSVYGDAKSEGEEDLVSPCLTWDNTALSD